MNTKIKTIIFFLFLTVSCVKERVQDNNIYYLLGDEMSDLISKEIESLKYNEYKNENFYIEFIGFTRDREINELILGYCEKCDEELLIKKTNRFFILKNYKIPIIYSGDIFFTNYDKKEKFNRKNKYQVLIRFDLNKSNVKKYVFQ